MSAWLFLTGEIYHQTYCTGKISTWFHENKKSANVEKLFCLHSTNREEWQVDPWQTELSLIVERFFLHVSLFDSMPLFMQHYLTSDISSLYQGPEIYKRHTPLKSQSQKQVSSSFTSLLKQKFSIFKLKSLHPKMHPNKTQNSRLFWSPIPVCHWQTHNTSETWNYFFLLLIPISPALDGKVEMRWIRVVWMQIQRFFTAVTAAVFLSWRFITLIPQSHYGANTTPNPNSSAKASQALIQSQTNWIACHQIKIGILPIFPWFMAAGHWMIVSFDDNLHA